MTSPLSPREENLLDLDTTDCEGQDNSDLDISWVKDLDRVQPLETCFDLMLDEHNYKVNVPLYDLYMYMCIYFSQCMKPIFSFSN